MDKQFQSAAEAAAHLADDPGIKQTVEQEVLRSRMVAALLGLRVQKGLTQKQIAERMKCDPSKISKLESGNDLGLKWADVVAYLSAMDVGLSVLFEDNTLPKAARIKQHVFRIHDLLEELVVLAKEVEDDPEIPKQIHEFMGQVLLNFALRFGDSYGKISNIVKIDPDAEMSEVLPKQLVQSGKATASVAH